MQLGPNYEVVTPKSLLGDTDDTVDYEEVDADDFEDDTAPRWDLFPAHTLDSSAHAHLQKLGKTYQEESSIDGIDVADIPEQQTSILQRKVKIRTSKINRD